MQFFIVTVYNTKQIIERFYKHTIIQSERERDPLERALCVVEETVSYNVIRFEMYDAVYNGTMRLYSLTIALLHPCGVTPR